MNNPTLRVVIIARDDAAVTGYSDIFASYRNVEVVAPPPGDVLGFPQFNELILTSVPRAAGVA
jgi:hypothetical protein